jgi:hypothetical protein
MLAPASVTNRICGNLDNRSIQIDPNSFARFDGAMNLAATFFYGNSEP